MNQYEFIKVIQFVHHAAGIKDKRNQLNGLLLRVASSGSIQLVATDGQRLARIELAPGSIDVSRLPNGDYIVANYSIKSLLKIFKTEKTSTGKIAFIEMFGPHGIGITSTAGVTAELTLIDEKYPDIDRIMPEETAQHVSRFALSAKFIVDAAKAALHIAEPRLPAVLVQLNGEHIPALIDVPSPFKNVVPGSAKIVIMSIRMAE